MFEITVMEVTRSRAVQKYVEERCAAGLCLHQGCEEKQRALGNCDTHAQRIYRKLRSVPKKLRSKARAKLIEDGVILAPYESYELKTDQLDKSIGEFLK